MTKSTEQNILTKCCLIIFGMSERKLNDRNLDDFLSGALILGTGGGGGIEWGKSMLDWIKEHDKVISIIRSLKKYLRMLLLLGLQVLAEG